MELAILKDLVIIFALSTGVNYLFTKIKVPTVIGYMFTGIVCGPHLLSLIGSTHEIEIMAEIGVVLLMFTIGMEFSLKHLIKIRKIVFVGGFLQMSLTAISFYFVSRIYGLDWKPSLFIGFLTALSSTAVVLKILQERFELTSNYGRTILGILIFQDIMLVPLILFTQILGGNEGAALSYKILLLLIKTAGIIGFVYVGQRWFIPKLLHVVAMTKNQELFMMSILLICLGVALLTSELGMSLAFGAFLAGLMISESDYNHNAFGNLVPFKDTFTSFFYVSIGMLLDLHFVFDNLEVIALTVTLVLVLKSLFAGGAGFLLGHTLRGTIMVGLGLRQVGEFSFILAKMGLESNIISERYYQLFLAVAVITMSISPFMIHIAHPLSDLICKLRLPRVLIDGLFPLPEIKIPSLQNHLVIIGKDIRALNMAVMAEKVNMPYVSIVFDPSLAREQQKKGKIVVYGDAVNEPILNKAHVDTADIVLVSVGDVIAAMSIVEKVRHLNPAAHIIVRALHTNEMEELYRIGANEVIPEKFETAIEMFSHVPNKRLLPYREINKIVAKIRDDHYGLFREKGKKANNTLLDELPNIEISAFKIDASSEICNRTLEDIKLRHKSDVTLVALKRDDHLFEHPDKNIKFQENDIAYVLGKPEQIANAVELFTGSES